MLHGAADAFAIAIKRRNEKDDLIHLKPSGCAAIRIPSPSLICINDQSPGNATTAPKSRYFEGRARGVREMDIKIFLAVLIVATAFLLASYFLPPL